MQEDTVVGLPRPGGTVEDDPLLAVLREGARQMRPRRSRPRWQPSLRCTPIRSTRNGVVAWSAMAMHQSERFRPGSGRSRSGAPACATAAQAGFVVLKSPHMPSVFVELGYLSNPADEKALADDARIARLATTVTRAVDIYFGAGPS